MKRIIIEIESEEDSERIRNHFKKFVDKNFGFKNSKKSEINVEEL